MDTDFRRYDEFLVVRLREGDDPERGAIQWVAGQSRHRHMQQQDEADSNISGRGLRVGIMGAGAVGCYLGGALVATGIDTILVGRERIRSDIEVSGLTLMDLAGMKTVVPRDAFSFVAEPDALADADVVLVTVKSGASREAAAALAHVLRPDAIVVSMQNGLHNAEVLQAGLPRNKVLAGIVGFNVVANGRGVFQHTTSGRLVIEASADARITQLAASLRTFGLVVDLRSEVRALQWSKLILNLNNALGALSGVPTPQLVFDDGYRRIVRAVIVEALGVMKMAGVATARLGALPPAVFPFLLGLPNPLVRLVLRAQFRIDRAARSSMWADLTQGRATEVEELNGEIVRLAMMIGRDAPLNRRIVEVVHEAERSGPGSPNMSAAALARALGL